MFGIIMNLELFPKYLLSTHSQMDLNLFFLKTNNRGLKFMNQSEALICL